MRYLVTGGAGFIGSHLVDAILARGDEVVVLDDLSGGREANLAQASGHMRFEMVCGSALDGALVRHLMAQVDRCFHLAASVGVEAILAEPLRTLLNNTRGTDVVMAAAAAASRPLVFASTSEVYGQPVKGLVRESDDRVLGPVETPRWSYATAKTFGEVALCGYVRAQGCDMRALRLFNVVGTRQSAESGMVLPRFVRQAMTGRDITVYGDGRQRRCFTHVDDAVDAFLRLDAAPGARGRILNVGADEDVSIRTLAQQVQAAAGSSSRIVYLPFEQIFGADFAEPAARRPDTSELRLLTGWRPIRTLADAIADLLGAVVDVATRSA